VKTADLVRRLLDRSGEGLAPLTEIGDPVLRAVTEPYDGQLDDDELAALIALMARTMRAAPGVGLAAPQIGLPLALAVMEDPGIGLPELEEARERQAFGLRAVLNPSYEPVGDTMVGFYEGCLSVPGLSAVVARHRQVRFWGTDEHGDTFDEVLTGWTARIAQHETDHLGGTVYVDRCETRSFATHTGWGGHWALEPVPRTAAAELGFELP
jgi:peptide deformylase